ncbi:MAG: hypothetical protein NUV44_01885 [Candidatus Scalindua sp.]|nr:hypothetical protein [Candidatus Scalindua sp.]
MKRSVLIFLIFSAISLVATLLPKYLDRNKFLQGIKSVRSEQKQDAKSGVSDPCNRNDSMLLFMRREVEEIERLKSSPGIESDVVLDSVLEIVKEMISVYSEYESAMIKVFMALESNTINTPEDIGKSIERAKQAEIAANRMDRLNKEMGTQLKESLVGSRELPSDNDSTMRGFYLTADIERRSELYKMNAEVMKEAQLVLQVLEKEWGAWAYNAEGVGVLFESESAVIEFNNTVAQLGVLVQKVKGLQLTILKTHKGDSG